MGHCLRVHKEKLNSLLLDTEEEAYSLCFEYKGKMCYAFFVVDSNSNVDVQEWPNTSQKS